MYTARLIRQDFSSSDSMLETAILFGPRCCLPLRITFAVFSANPSLLTFNSPCRMIIKAVRTAVAVLCQFADVVPARYRSDASAVEFVF